MTETSFIISLAAYQHLDSDNTDENGHKIGVESMFDLRDGLQHKS